MPDYRLRIDAEYEAIEHNLISTSAKTIAATIRTRVGRCRHTAT